MEYTDYLLSRLQNEKFRFQNQHNVTAAKLTINTFSGVVSESRNSENFAVKNTCQ